MNVTMMNCELCSQYETYKKEAMDLHMTMAHKYKKMEKSESKLAEIAEKINGGNPDKLLEKPPEPTPPQRPAYTPRRRSTLYDCTKCKYRFLNEEGRDQHLEKEHDPSDPLKTDPNHPDNLKKAEEEKNGTSESTPQRQYTPRRRSTLYDCTKCKYRFLNEEGRDQHLEKEHDPSDPLKTDPNHPDNIKKAEEEKNGTSTPATREPYRPRGRSQLFKCPKCIYKFLSQDGVDSHLEKEHDPNDPDDPNAEPPKPKGESTYKPRRRSQTFDCTKCTYRFLNQEGLDAHLKKDH